MQRATSSRTRWSDADALVVRGLVLVIIGLSGAAVALLTAPRALSLLAFFLVVYGAICLTRGAAARARLRG